MRHSTDAIEQMRAINWFSQAGVREEVGTALTVRWLGSWTEATTVRGEVESGDAFLEGTGMLTRELGRNFHEHYRRKWNRFALEVQSQINATICPIFASLIDANLELRRLPGAVSFMKNTIRWDLVHFAMEHIYSDLVPPRSYHAVFGVYQSGHFPCNWDERWPDGTLEVF